MNNRALKIESREVIDPYTFAESQNQRKTIKHHKKQMRRHRRTLEKRELLYHIYGKRGEYLA